MGIKGIEKRGQFTRAPQSRVEESDLDSSSEILDPGRKMKAHYALSLAVAGLLQRHLVGPLVHTCLCPYIRWFVRPSVRAFVSLLSLGTYDIKDEKNPIDCPIVFKIISKVKKKTMFTYAT